MRKIILASASPRRKELLERAVVQFQVRTSQGEEIITEEIPSKIVEELSKTKAENVFHEMDTEDADLLLIGADTIVSYNGKVLGKPSDEEEAVKTLLELQGKTHQVYTGVTVLEKTENEIKYHTFSECTEVIFYPVTEKEIRDYVRTGEPMDKAGSYGIQGAWGIYVKGIHGDYNNVVGLPVARLLYEMKKIGIDMRGNL